MAISSIASLVICVAMMVSADQSVNSPGFVGMGPAPGVVAYLGFYFVQLPSTLIGFGAGIGGLAIDHRDWFCIVGLIVLIASMIASGLAHGSMT